uniref:Fe2OG dioxygenase domain-containing protein n=1 Tax=Parascaris univalens TaxID=6257 RepID=A0A915BLG5_PARUN
MIDEGKVKDDEGPASRKLVNIPLGSSIDEATYLWKGPSANDFIVPEAPPTIRYIRDFITPEEEELFLAEVYAAPKPKWQQLLNRRLQNWGGIVGKKALISDDNIPHWLNFAINKLMSLPDSFPASNRPNHVLINEYQPGQGIMAHTDGPAFYPLVSTISLGSDLFLDYYRPVCPQNTISKELRYVGSMLLERRSLILVTDEAYSYYLHEIDERLIDEITEKVFNRCIAQKEIGEKIDRKLRVSLTIRNVPKVSKQNLSSLLMKR